MTQDLVEPLSNRLIREPLSTSVEFTDRNESAADDAGLEVGGTGEDEETSSFTLGICEVSMDGDIDRDALAW